MTSQQAKAAEFHACDKVYASEREALMATLDSISAVESCAGGAFATWITQCKDPTLRGALKIIAEREAYHGRALGRRLAELGGQPRHVLTPFERDLEAYLSNPDVSDADKVERLHELVPDPAHVVSFVLDIVDAIKEDTETREILRLYQQDEVSSATWLCNYRNQLHTGSRVAAE